MREQAHNKKNSPSDESRYLKRNDEEKGKFKPFTTLISLSRKKRSTVSFTRFLALKSTLLNFTGYFFVVFFGRFILEVVECSQPSKTNETLLTENDNNKDATRDT